MKPIFSRISRKSGIPLILFTAVLLTAAGPGPYQAKKKSPGRDLKAFIEECRPFGGEMHGNLLIVPVRCPPAIEKADVDCLDDALRNRTLIVSELSEGGEVNRLAVENRGKIPVFIMAGEILRGAKQDRILKHDVLLPARSGRLIVDAFCVEHGRWRREGASFTSEKKTANIAVRQAAKAKQDQGSVWENVSVTNEAMAAEAPTDSLSSSFESKRFREKRRSYWGGFEDFPERFPDARGVVVIVDGRVLAADLFSRREMFTRLWDKLLDSYIVEAVAGGRNRDRGLNGAGAALKFLERIMESRISEIPSVGLGKCLEISSDEVAGSSLLVNGVPLHLDLFPQMDEDRNPDPLPLQRNYRR